MKSVANGTDVHDQRKQGYILSEFKPVENYALIYAIEVTPESKK